VAEDAREGDADPMAQLTDRAEAYAGIWRSAIERNAAGTYKPEDWFDDVNRTFVMAAEDAARAFAAVVDAVSARTADAGATDAAAGDGDGDGDGSGSG
jgi:hypothetical protein